MHPTAPLAPTAPRRPSWPSWPALLATLLLAACASPPPGSPGERATAPAAPPAAGAGAIAATANPLATRAALRMIERGGSAADAAVAAQMVLGLVEPQSSGIGGGTVALYWDAAAHRLESLDGLAAAPARATRGLTVDTDGSALKPEQVRHGGRSVGVPGTLALWERLHREHGRLPWAELFAPAIELAERGFAMPPYLHAALAGAPAAAIGDGLRALFFGADGRPLPVGTVVRNPAYAQTLRDIAAQGPAGWLAGGGAREIAAAAQGGARPGLLDEHDLLAYRVEPREPLCGPFRRYRVCVMGPASFGGVAVLQILQIVEDAQPAPDATATYDFDDPAFVHRYVEAGRLAQADRLRWVGDPGYVDVPLGALLDPAYLRRRAASIRGDRALPPVPSGIVAAGEAPRVPAPAAVHDATSQIAIVDRDGNALAATTTINLNFGSGLMAGGFVLNDAMTNFVPAPPPGQVRANQMAPGKRPVTSMAPAIVFDALGAPVVVGGSAGGGPIVDYVASSLIEMLADGRTPAQALARGHVSTATAGLVQVEKGTAAEALAPALCALGHTVAVTELKSGLGFVRRDGAHWIGAADPRRDGVAEVLAP